MCVGFLWSMRERGWQEQEVRRVGRGGLGRTAFDLQVGSHWSQRGRYQLRSPSQRMVAGISSTRTRVASRRERDAMPKPICCNATSWPVANAMKTTMMMAAAPVTSRAVDATPWTMASAVWSEASRARGSG